MVVRLARHNLEEDDDRRVERTNPAQPKVLSGVEHEPVRPGSQRRVGRHQRPQPAVRVGVPVTHELPLIGCPAAIEHDVDACGRTPERCVENVSRDRAQAEQLYSVDSSATQKRLAVRLRRAPSFPQHGFSTHQRGHHAAPKTEAGIGRDGVTMIERRRIDTRFGVRIPDDEIGVFPWCDRTLARLQARQPCGRSTHPAYDVLDGEPTRGRTCPNG